MDTIKEIHFFEHLFEPLQSKDARVFGDKSALETLYTHEPDLFFEPPYSPHYEALCVAEHERACALVFEKEQDVTDFLHDVYQHAWQILPDAEFCGLIADDLETLYRLSESSQPLSDFAHAKLNWYRQGRIPWGYEGTYPHGRWIIL